MANIIQYNEKRLKEKIKAYNIILDMLKEHQTIREITYKANKKQSYYYRPIKNMINEGYIIQVDAGMNDAAVYQAVRQEYGKADLVEISARQMAARLAYKAKQAAMNPVLPCGRIIRLEDYQDRYAATQKMRTKPKIDARIGSTFSTMTF